MFSEFQLKVVAKFELKSLQNTMFCPSNVLVGA
jgi:hypothetical protein